MADDERQYHLIGPEELVAMSKDRQRRIVAFRTLVTSTLEEMLMLLHTLQALEEGEEFRLEAVTDCGFSVNVNLCVNDVGICDRDKHDMQADTLINLAFEKLHRTKGAALHMVSGANSLADAEEKARDIISKRKEAETVPEKKARLADVESLITDVLERRKERKSKEKKKEGSSGTPPPPSQPLGFMS